ncbi:Glutamate--tRNA ligase [Candidatus Burarchaeum australiense]|nr:Glutamate--tRNA ligase [Candidatus Burarchaeum australiense]
MDSIEDVLWKFALKNAHDYGTAQANAVVGKALAELPEARNNMRETMALAQKIVAVVNTMKKEELEEKLAHYSFAEKKEERGGLKLPKAEKGNVVTRFPPEPSGYPHIGHAKAALLDYECARQYDGKFLLRFDDTNPEKEKQEYVDALKDGLTWLGISWDDETYVSDRMPELYGYAEQMIESRDAYVCTCSQEKIREGRSLGQGCDCRERAMAENLKLWKGLREGEGKEESGVLRFKGNMDDLNTVMRDPVLFRIIEKKHFRQGFKYRLWPLYDFEAPIIDSLEGVTHAMRTKEYELRDQLYFAILDSLKLREPELVEFSRLQIRNAPISKRLLLPLIAEGKVRGWDDPRLPTLTALRRRGILPAAIKQFVLSFGLGKAESEPTWEALLVENRKLLDPVSLRLFFVPSPVKLTVTGAPEKEAKLRRHPSDKSKGVRSVNTRGNFYISGSDAKALREGETFRLKDLYNVKIESKSAAGTGGSTNAVVSASYAGEQPLPEKKVQWVAAESALEANVLVPRDLLRDGEYDENSLLVDRGFVEAEAASLTTGTIVQFERYGFCKLDDKARLQFIFTNP